VPEDTYLGIRVFRFYFKCTRCSAELAMKTDPKNSDYVMEAGASRNFEPWRDKSQQVPPSLLRPPPCAAHVLTAALASDHWMHGTHTAD